MIKFLRVFAVLFSTLALITPGLASASSGPEQQQLEINKQISQVNSAVEDVNNGVEEAQKALDTAVANQHVLAGQINSLDGAINAAQLRVFNAQDVFTKAETVFEKADTDLKVKQRQVNQSIANVRTQAVEMITGGSTDTLEQVSIVLDASNVTDMTRRAAVMEVVADTHKNVLEENRRLKAEAKKLEASAQTARDEAQKQRDIVVEEESKLQDQRYQLAALNNQATLQAKNQAALIEKLNGEKIDYQKQLVQLQTESSQISKLLNSTQKGEIPIPEGAVFAMPIKGAPITSPFGMRLDPVLNVYQLHAGTDFGAPEGTPIHAAGDGTVIFSGQQTGYGNVIIIDHGNGLATLYGHQSVLLAEVGTEVKTGDVIGLVGHTGYATGPHLHFEVRVEGKPVDPIPYLI